MQTFISKLSKIISVLEFGFLFLFLLGTTASCSHRPKIGSGCGSALAYYYDAFSRQCQSFLYSGCDKNYYFTSHTDCSSACGLGQFPYHYMVVNKWTIFINNMSYFPQHYQIV